MTDRSALPGQPQSSEQLASILEEPPEALTVARQSPVPTSIKVLLHRQLLENINLNAIDKMARPQIAAEITPLLKSLLAERHIDLDDAAYNSLAEEILDEVLGLGPLEPLLKDTSVSDILVNTYKQVYVERYGRLEKMDSGFQDNAHLARIIQKIVSAVGRRVDESQPWVDARLADGTRVNALLPPCAVDGPLLSIRKFSKIPFTIETLIENGTITGNLAELMSIIVKFRLNVLISGGTGTGKTTFLNSLSSFIDNSQRIVTIEDTAELQLQQEHVARMETRPENAEGAGEVTQRDLLRNALRMRPDRIIVGEVRGPEVIDMLQAMNTGHDGSMTTVHANSPRDAVTRLEHMAAMAGFDIPSKDLRSQISSAINFIIQIQRFSDGRRRVTSLQEIVGMEGDVVVMQEIYVFRRTGIDANGNILGAHTPTGVRPKFAARAAEYGQQIPESMFANQEG